MFDKRCQALGIEHRLILPLFLLDTLKPMAWWNATMDVLAILKTHHFDSSLDMKRTLKHYVYLYNYHFHQDSLGCITPIQAMQNGFRDKPHLFSKEPSNCAGFDIY